MAQVIVLGGCGAVGRVAVKTLVKHNEFSKVIIADYTAEAAKKLAAELGSPKVSTVQFDAMDPASVRKAIHKSDVVLNCVGPFYSTVKPIISAVMESGINYVDICDDVDVTLELLDMDWKVKEAGITLLLGMGNSPGATNIIGKFIAQNMLDQVDSIDIFHAHGGEPFEGEGVIAHRFHCMTIDIPMFIDGQLKYVKYFEDDGIALRQSFTFPILGEVPLYPYPHPEQVTMPRYIKTKQVTNKGSVIPNRYYDLTRDLCMLGLHSKEPIEVKGKQVVPYDFAVSYIMRERERILKETNFGSQRGCCSVVAKGIKDGAFREFRVHMASRSQALGEGTGIPAAMGAIMMNRGKVTGTGVLPPEACINPNEFLDLMKEVMDLKNVNKESDSFSGLIAEIVDEKGNITSMNL